MTRASGFLEATRRISCRASRSASSVTVQVLTTTTSAVNGESAEVADASSNSCSTAAPSDCEARQPKFATKNLLEDIRLSILIPTPASCSFRQRSLPALLCNRRASAQDQRPQERGSEPPGFRHWWLPIYQRPLSKPALRAASG